MQSRVVRARIAVISVRALLALSPEASTDSARGGSIGMRARYSAQFPFSWNGILFSYEIWLFWPVREQFIASFLIAYYYGIPCCLNVIYNLFIFVRIAGNNFLLIFGVFEIVREGKYLCFVILIGGGSS